MGLDRSKWTWNFLLETPLSDVSLVSSLNSFSATSRTGLHFINLHEEEEERGLDLHFISLLYFNIFKVRIKYIIAGQIR